MIDPPASNAIIVNAAEQDHLIDSVTVFQAGRAEIKRRVQLELKKGQTQITIEHLPNCLVEDSLRVQGTGTAMIFDVVYHSSKPQYRHRYDRVDNSSNDEEDEEESKLYNSVRALKKQRNVVENQISFLDTFGRSAADGQNSSIENLERFLDMYGSRRDVLDKKIQELDLGIGQAEKALRAIQKNSKKPESESDEYLDRQTKITVTVMSKEEGEAELMLAYVVSNASWIPIYEIRALVSSSPDSPSTIALHYRASLTQTTGEDWPEVALTLSTATPFRGAYMPTLSTWRIGPPPAPEVPRGRYDSPQVIRVGAPYNYDSGPQVIRVTTPPGYRCSSRSRSRSSRSYSPTRVVMCDSRYDREEKPAPMIVRQADTVDAGVLSAAFNIPGRSNIPSDQGNHKVLIASLDFQVDPEWACIPRKDESVFLRCNIVNSSEFTFLPGKASVFIGDSFVSKSQIQHVPPNDSFKLSLGVDTALRVTYQPVRTHNQTNSQSLFTFPGLQKQPKQVTKKYTQQITIRNARPTTVQALHILDHVPVSDDSTIKVNVTSPQGLQESNQPAEDAGDATEKRHETWVHPQDGVQARWAPPDMGGEGAIEWVCAVGAGEEVELKLGWEVSAPEGTTWTNL